MSGKESEMRMEEREEKNPLRVGTLFSGIGAFEAALKKMGIPHEIVFACDNGEIELIPLNDAEERKEVRRLRKKRIKTPEEIKWLTSYEVIVSRREADYRNKVKMLASINDKRKYVESLYEKFAPGKENLVKKTYRLNHSVRDDDFHYDVRFLDGEDYRGRIDIMVGGSPCQSFSSNGKRRGIEDVRGTLFYDYARIIGEVRPKSFIFENVKGMLVHDRGRTWEIIRNTFESLDYNIYLNHDADGNECPLLNAADYGIPQNRERIFLVGIRKDIQLDKPFEFPHKMKLHKFVPAYLDEHVPKKYYLGEKGFTFVTTHPTRARVGQQIMNCQKANQQFNWNGDFIFEPLSAKHTLEILERAFIGEWEGVRGVVRMFTPRECLRLMGFPESFKYNVDDNTMYRQCGNSIVVNVLEVLIDSLEKTGVFR